MQSQDNVKVIACFAALSVALGVAESLVGLPVPGVRLGVANIGIMLAAYTLDFKSTLSVGIIKSILVPLFAGNLVIRLSISLPATIASVLAIYFCSKILKKYTSPLSAGILGGVTHISIQFVVAEKLYIKSPVIYTALPYFVIFSALTGVFTGLITMGILNKLFWKKDCTF